jgi:hypothetical protein
MFVTVNFRIGRAGLALVAFAIAVAGGISVALLG